MFEVGFTEIVLIFGIALLVLGPARLPKLAADLGRWAGRARAMARQLRTQLEQEVNQFDPMADTTRKPAPATIHPTIAAPAPAAAQPGGPVDAGPVGHPPPETMEVPALTTGSEAAPVHSAPAQEAPQIPDKDDR